MKYVSEQNNMEIKKMREMSEIEIEKFQQMVQALGADTLQAIATSSSDNQVGQIIISLVLYCYDKKIRLIGSEL